jgi:hypothetical protein
MLFTLIADCSAHDWAEGAGAAVKFQPTGLNGRNMSISIRRSMRSAPTSMRASTGRASSMSAFGRGPSAPPSPAGNAKAGAHSPV